jgi:hypothetical protein
LSRIADTDFVKGLPTPLKQAVLELGNKPSKSRWRRGYELEFILYIALIEVRKPSVSGKHFRVIKERTSSISGASLGNEVSAWSSFCSISSSASCWLRYLMLNRPLSTSSSLALNRGSSPSSIEGVLVLDEARINGEGAGETEVDALAASASQGEGIRGDSLSVSPNMS